ncbi:MAG: aminoacyl-tRNA hydrolase [Phormidesmis priestleyi]|uniref:Peptidyl-tRNA hydrolase n=1 Tax=Phormidesmis priestleyi TaxID=268141 RepID=A0A2W4YR90_9CYAN|nr:MAG: aminoacyl-tRNA hydrolase [Phormidesmis priestleyi]
MVGTSSVGNSAEKNAKEIALLLPRLIVGLGNPGTKYDRTRHNIGFEVIEALAKSYPGLSLVENKRFQGKTGEFRSGSDSLGRLRHRVVLLQPTTYMNLSGQAVRAVLDWYKLDPTSVLVVYDDMDLPTGKLRLRLSGGAGGHNGMKSIISHLGTKEFPRLRVGIGATEKGTGRDDAVVSHVLGRFAPDQRKIVDAVIPMAVDAIDFSLRKGFERAMNLYNGREVEL